MAVSGRRAACLELGWVSGRRLGEGQVAARASSAGDFGTAVLRWVPMGLCGTLRVDDCERRMREDRDVLGRCRAWVRDAGELRVMGRLGWALRCALLLVLAVLLPGSVARAGAAQVAVAAVSGLAPWRVAVSCEGVGQVLLELPRGLRADGSVRVAGSAPVRVAGTGRVTAVDRRTGGPVSRSAPATRSARGCGVTASRSRG